MSLDFSALVSLQNRRQAQAEGSLALEPQETEAPASALVWLNRQKQEQEATSKAYKTYQDNIKRAGTLRSEITKGILQGEAPAGLLLKAIECISLMTGDTVILTQNKENLRAIYGWGLDEPTMLKEELEDAKKRLAMLSRPELENAPTDTYKRIQTAIYTHRELVETLENKLKEGKNE